MPSQDVPNYVPNTRLVSSQRVLVDEIVERNFLIFWLVGLDVLLDHLLGWHLVSVVVRVIIPGHIDGVLQARYGDRWFW